MRLCATLVAVASVCILVFPFNANAQQEADDNTDPRVLLREASALLPQIEKVRQPSALAGIAGKQVAAGDYEGALATYRANAKRGDNGSDRKNERSVSQTTVVGIRDPPPRFRPTRPPAGGATHARLGSQLQFRILAHHKIP